MTSSEAASAPGRSISVMIAAYNAASTIERAVRSALLEPEVQEVIVVDDCSRDDTAAIAKRADDGTGRLIILSLARNSGPSAARNLALKVATGEWVTILDADDYVLPGRFAKLLAFGGEADMVADDLYQIAETDVGPPTKSLLGPEFDAPMTLDLFTFVDSNVTRKGQFRKELGFIKPLIRRAMLDNNNIRYDNAIRLGEDYVLYCQLLAAGARALVCPAAGYVSVVRANSLSGNHSIEDLRRLRDANIGLMTIDGLSDKDRQAMSAHYKSVDCRLQWRLLIEAVKSRNPMAAIKTFIRPYPVPVYLAKMLVLEFLKRTGLVR